MNRALRYGVSLIVGLSVAGLVTRFFPGDPFVTAAIFPLYAAATSLVVAHRKAWRETSRGDPDRLARFRGAMGGGIGAFTASVIAEISLPAGVAALGLMVFGMALGIAELERVTESAPA
ncbi:hypothetical protein [Halorubrum sp. SD612]|uniref:hypothetical protein n=1 Tax=Halorubrum sp. SD612 TaxID=1855863 RepID=UPI000A2D901F|nr:hypothetical protein [Halorubrum sp. SD612]OTF03044.1 hypothetical protein B9G38_14290 [Halorubrum sp. SD612]